MTRHGASAGHRGWAVVALVASAAFVATLVYLLVGDLPRVGIGIALMAVAVALGAVAFVRGGRLRLVGLVLAGVSFVAGVLVVVVGGHPLEDLVLVGVAGLVVLAVRRALRPDVRLPSAAAPQRPVMIWNAKSGGGKAVTHDLPAQARRRGIEPVELTEGTDLRALLEQLVDEGADGLAAAGGDGTQAVVAAVAAEHDLPFACIPAGTRNHFALDLGVDRDDVVGALDAFVDGGERVVDLAEVNGTVFVNNCSLGLYAEAVQRDEYRGAKLRTILATATEAFGPSDAVTLDYRWTGPDGSIEQGATVILVSNDVYRLGGGVGAGTRPRLDAGVLGVAVLRSPDTASTGAPVPLWSAWSVTEFEVDADEPAHDGSVHVGVDGEAMTMTSPLRFTTRPGALRVRISPRHPGASPSAVQPETVRGTILLLWRLALGRSTGGRR